MAVEPESPQGAPRDRRGFAAAGLAIAAVIAAGLTVAIVSIDGRATGVDTVVTPCAGCYRTFTQLYPGVDEGWPGSREVLHMVEYLDRLMTEGRLPLREGGRVTMVAYHDPCDLGRHCGVYDAPRRVLSALPGVVLEEFPDARQNGACCGGGGALRAFDAERSMGIARERLGSLAEGMDAVVSACPSCKANLRLAASRMAREGEGRRLRVMDVAEVVASQPQ